MTVNIKNQTLINLISDVLTSYLGLEMPFKADYMDGDFELETLDSIGLQDGEAVFFNEDKSRWFDIDTVLDYFKTS
mgnify:CR=1 FL=1|tara:strand:+ start:21 stop:248 length:228 start_codon:yes stop_codon:yes gene_type:complete